jgi:hypothetical protein
MACGVRRRGTATEISGGRSLVVEIDEEPDTATEASALCSLAAPLCLIAPRKTNRPPLRTVADCFQRNN